jgi:hypothetical protein
MGKYVAANPHNLVELKYNPYQVAALQALAARHCPKCAFEWAVKYGDVSTKKCPKCGTTGERDFTRLALIAGRQGGKTRFGTLAVALELAMPESYWWITAPTYRDLTDFVEPAFFAQIPQAWVDNGDWSASDRILTLPNRSVCAFRSLENPQILRGPTLDGMLMDEACQVSEAAFDVGNAMLAIKQGVWLFTTTPKGEDWVHERLTLMAEGGEPGFWVVRYKSIENPIMNREFIEQQRRQMSDEMFRQEYEASIESFKGAIYGDLVHPCIITEATIREYIPEWPRIDPSRACVVGLDPGSDHPFAGVLLVSTDKAMIAVGEYKQRQLPAMTHAAGLKLMVRGLQPRWGIDRSQAQMQIELAQHGIFTAPAENNVLAGIERVKSWMKSGRFKILESKCPELCKEVKSYRWAETEKNDGSYGQQQPYKKRDDLCDALRYAFMLWPHLPDPVEQTTGVRDLSALPDKMRGEIERLMRHEGSSKDSIADGIGEFYSRVDEDEATSAGHFDEYYG